MCSPSLAPSTGKAPRAKVRGFTLVELLIAVVVVGVLAAVALPSFMESVRKSRRSEAFAAMAAVQQAQERWRTNNPTYANQLTSLGITNANTSSNYYQLSISPVAPQPGHPTAYIVTAEGIGGTQVDDAQCRKLSVQVNSGTVSYAGCGNCSTFIYSATDPCWKR